MHRRHQQSNIPSAASGFKQLCLWKLNLKNEIYFSILCKSKKTYNLILRLCDVVRSFKVTKCFVTQKTWETFKKRRISVDNKGRCKILGIAANRSHEDQFATPFANHELRRLDMKNNPLDCAILGFTKLYVCWFNWYFLWKHPNVFLSGTRNKLREQSENFSPLGATNSASIVRAVSPKECNLFESSMLSSSSILVSS